MFLVGAPRATPDKTHILECQPVGSSLAQTCNAMWGTRLTPGPSGGHVDLAPDVEASTTARHLVRIRAQQAGGAYACQSAHAQTMITFVFREHTVARASMPKA